MKICMKNKMIAFFKKETVLSIAVILAVLSAFFVTPDKEYIKYIDYRTLAILFCLMTVMAGFSDIGVFTMLAKYLIEHVKELIEAGITSFKIEGRMKSTYYVATTVNAYRRAIDACLNNKNIDFDAVRELEKTSHRKFTTGFYFGSDEKTNNEDSTPVQDMIFTGLVRSTNVDGFVAVEMRNRFKVGDTLEILAADDNFNKQILITEIKDKNCNNIDESIKVQEIVFIKTDLNLKPNDILRRDTKK